MHRTNEDKASSNTFGVANLDYISRAVRDTGYVLNCPIEGYSGHFTGHFFRHLCEFWKLKLTAWRCCYVDLIKNCTLNIAQSEYRVSKSFALGHSFCYIALNPVRYT